MRDETKNWMSYATENLQSSKVLLENHLYNSCLQHVQQAIEKALKAIFIEKAIKLRRTHDILELRQLLLTNDIATNLSEDDCDFINSIYLPSKYPVGSALPDYEPDQTICLDAIEIGERVLTYVRQYLESLG